MKIKQILKTIVPLATASFGLVACFGNGAPEATDNVTYGVLSESTAPVTYSTFALQMAFKKGQLNAGFAPSDDGALANESNVITQFGTSAENVIRTTPNANVISAYAIKYNTPGVNARVLREDIDRTVSGLVITPPDNVPVKGVVLYYHPTETTKNQVPSCLPESNFVAIGSLTPTTGVYPKAAPSNFTYCNNYPAQYYMLNYDTTYITTLGATFAANGYIVVAPDYIGQGNDVSTMHPYVVYPQVNAKSGIYMLNAAKTLLKNIGYNRVEFGGNTKLFITGFSEGGAYALNASQQLQTNMASYLQNLGLHLTVTAPAEGAYDLRDSQMNFEFANVQDGLFNGGSLNESDLVSYQFDADDMPISVAPSTFAESINPWNAGSSIATAMAKPYLISYALTAYAYYSLGNQTAGYNQIMIPAFWQNIPYLVPNPNQAESAIKPYIYSGNNYTTLQMYMIPSLLATNGLSIIFNSSNLTNPSNGQLYNTKQATQFNFYALGQDAGISPESRIIPPLPTGNGLNNSAAAMVPENIRHLPMFVDTMNKASTYKWQTNSPINFINMDYDSVVTVANLSTAYPYMNNLAPSLVESTHIQNFQISNDIFQFYPNLDFSPVVMSRYWAPLPDDLVKLNNAFDKTRMAIPIDHTNAGPFLAIAALSIFDSYTTTGQHKTQQQTTLKTNSAQTKAKFNEMIAKWKAAHKQ